MALHRLTLDEAIGRVLEGGVVVFPTESCYAIGCRAYDGDAVARIVDIKQRPEGKPLPVLLPNATVLRRHLPESPLAVLADLFWPGPLTLVVPAFPGLPAPVTAGTNMAGVRAPAHPVARALVEAVGEPVVATSANLSGRPTARSPEECVGLTADGLVDGGTLPPGASTVVGMAGADLIFHAVGDLPEREIRAAWAASRVL